MTPLYQMTETRHGQMVVLGNDTYISRSLIEYGEWTESEFELMAQVLQPGDHVADIGANVGSLTLAFAARVAGNQQVPAGHVFAFEPQPRIFQLLATNCTLNGATNVRLFHAGCGAEPGAIEIAEIGYEGEFNYGALGLKFLAECAAAPSAPARRTVPIVKLDDVYDRDALKLVKIDVEGMELEVLKGAAGTLGRFRPVVYVENEFADKSPELIDVLRDLGYEAWWHVAPCFNPKNARGRSDDIFGGATCINMLCVPKERAGTIAGLDKVGSRDEHPRKAA